nr:synaptotagmin protein 4 [Hymenolepis microstoma]
MSVVSSKVSNKSSSIGSKKQPKNASNSASLVQSEKTRSIVSGTNKAATTNNGASKTLPFNAVTVPTASIKGRVLGDQELTEEELEHLASVCRRYEQLQRKEDERIKQIRDRAISKEKARRGVSRFDESHCALCSAAFMAVINVKSLCIQCDRYVCRNCVHHKINNEGILCMECFNECSNKARTGLWFVEKLQVAKKDGRIIPIAPTSALRASLIRKKREQSAASSVIGKPPPNPQKQNGNATDIVHEAAKRLAKDTSQQSNSNNQRQFVTLTPASGAEQLAFNVIFSGVDNLPKTTPRPRSRHHSTSGCNTLSTPAAGNTGSISEGLNTSNWDNRSILSAASVGSVTSVYSEREESFTHGIRITGDLNFSVDYDDKSGTLRIFIKQAHEIAIADPKLGSSNTYVKTYLLPDKTKASKRKTKVKKNSTSPFFNESLIYEISRSDVAYRTLQLSVWHFRRAKANLFLGEVLFPLADYQFSPTPVWRALQNRNSLNGDYDRRLTKGHIQLGVMYVTQDQEQGELQIYIKSATDLNVPLGASGGDGKNIINPFVKTYLLPERAKETKRKTKVIKKSNNPTWEEVLVYKGIVKTQIPSIGVQVVVWDAPKIGYYEYLGGCNLNAGSRSGFGMDATGIERSLWVEMMSKPNTMIEGNVPLRSTMD